MWAVYALLSAFFAALTSILAKIGIEGVNSNLATAVRTVVVVAMAWFVVFVTGTGGQELALPRAFRTCDRRFVAFLFPRFADRKGLPRHAG